MRLKLKLQPTPSLREKRAMRILAASAVLSILFFSLVFVYLNLGNEKKAYASGPSETMLSGSFIVNMGVVPQTNNNGLRPYGLIYDLIKNYRVPIKWSIEPTKARNGVDFVYNSVNYSGGTFVIPAEYITTAVAARITYWQTQGVQGVYTTSPVTIPVYATITNFPVIMIDNVAGLQAIIVNYYTLASIPSSAYTIGAPSGLNQCFDIWTNPHGDPTWTTHGYLYNFVVNNRGWIWSQCHCVSELESVTNANPPNEKLNFLSQSGLQCWQSGGCSGAPEFHATAQTSPFTYYYPADPEMQSMNNMHLSMNAGSERWFRPFSTGGWLSTTKVGVSTATGIAPTQGVLVVYGHAYGDTSYGRVMYCAGHDLTSGGGAAAQDRVSAVRTYFNFMLLAGKDRELRLTTTMPPDTLVAGSSTPVSVTVTTGTAPFAYLWTSDRGGTFSDAAAASTTYYAPGSPTDTFDVVRVVITDACNRTTFQSKRISVSGSASLPVSIISFSGVAVPQGIQLNWNTSSESNNDYFTLERSADGTHYEAVDNIDGSGNTSHTVQYNYVDESPVNGVNYYRLSQIDFDGSQKTFEPISVKLGDDASTLSFVNLYPNPFNGDFILTYHSNEKATTLLEILSSEGKRVYSETLKSSTGVNVYDFNSKIQLPQGIYFVTLSQGKTRTEAIRIVKK